MQYTIVTGSKAEDVIKQVNERLKDGWTLQGGLSASATENGSIYAQAMIKTEPAKPGEFRQSPLNLA